MVVTWKRRRLTQPDHCLRGGLPPPWPVKSVLEEQSLHISLVTAPHRPPQPSESLSGLDHRIANWRNAMTSKQPETFNLHVPDVALADLRERLSRTRFPDQAPGEPWACGTDLNWIAGFVDYWRDGFDWRAQEARLNSFPQYKVTAGFKVLGPRRSPMV